MLSKAVEWRDLAVNPLQMLKPIKTDDIGVIRFLTESEKRLSEEHWIIDKT